MAIPINNLTEILYDCDTPKEMFDALQKRSLLSHPGLMNAEKIIEYIEQIIQEYEAEAQGLRFLGATSVDRITRALLDSGTLNDRARQMFETLGKRSR